MSIFNFIKKKTIIFLIALFASGILTSCGIYAPSDARKVSPNSKERVKKNLEEGKGISLKGMVSDAKGSGGNYQFASSNPLWRAALEKLDFAPLSNVDYGGGIIITDWFSEGSSNEQIKISIRFLTNEIRSDSIDVIIHKKVCNTQNKCKINKVENTLNSEIRFAILKKAAQIAKQDLAIKKEDKSNNYKLPKNF